jgi:hypothetical protein
LKYFQLHDLKLLGLGASGERSLLDQAAVVPQLMFQLMGTVGHRQSGRRLSGNDLNLDQRTDHTVSEVIREIICETTY